MNRLFVDPPGVPATTDLSQAVRIGDLVFCSGQIGINADGRIADPDDVRAQMFQAFKNLTRVLDGAGANLQQVVKLTSYLLAEADRDALVEVRRAFFRPPFPASTLVIVKGLARPEYRYEVDAIAVIG